VGRGEQTPKNNRLRTAEVAFWPVKLGEGRAGFSDPKSRREMEKKIIQLRDGGMALED